MAEQSERGKETLCRLELALQRLVDGRPIKTKQDGRINLKRINDEAGLSSGGIYYYPIFIEKAQEKIRLFHQKNNDDKKSISSAKEKKLRNQREKEKILKQKYKEQRNQIKNFCDQVVAQNAQLEFALFEALEKISHLEQQLAVYKISSISNKK